MSEITKEQKIQQLKDQICYFEKFMSLNRKQQLEVIKDLKKHIKKLEKQEIA